ncbi:hypothetical protein SAMN02745194_04686 [Roseomonas rosea]|uniref:MmcQ/YjbR family DNA-binding protein n=1 Tax=Muricoccus roseus TaxID=198092 RepID=A0A1M6RHE3_9PROT|nr:MmcQ/YjbR family DNA-binding protein [Roseomonas rosea]SHK31853.1 hypothetical protein SAMN02745194_04686 [Roseomonas rosea]
MTPETFRQLALELPEVVEWEHHGKPDFRVGGRIFAALGWPDEGWGMVSLRPEEQAVLLRDAPAAFRRSVGRWGETGSTQVCLAEVDAATLCPALRLAWKGRAGKRLLTRYGEQLIQRTG